MSSENLGKLVRRVIVIGLDGATFDILQPWMEAGHLPVLKRLMDQGASGPLRSTIHPLTACAWNSFITGVNPGKHGVFDFTRRKLGSYDLELVNAHSRHAPSLWRLLSDAGRTVGVVNVPMTYPPEPVNGYLVSGIDTPDLSSPYTYPAELAQEIAPEHLIAVSASGTTHQRYLQETLEAVDRRFAVMWRLLQKGQPDFFMKVIMETDAIQHCSWDLMKQEGHPQQHAILQVYQRIDNHLQKLVDYLPEDTTLVVMSDHGAGPIEKVVYLDTWLSKLGLLRYAAKSVSPTALVRNAFKKIGRGVMPYMQRYLPYQAKGFLKRRTDVRAQVESFLAYSEVDWANTRAFSVGNQGSIVINMVGREPLGTVQPGQEYEDLRAWIIQELYQLRDPDTGESIVEKAYKREELYQGPYLELAPDILIRWKDDAYLSKKELGRQTREVFGKGLRFGKYGSQFDMEQTGTHRMEGILIISGALARAGVYLNGAEIIDLAPTLLWLLGEAVPRSMDGKVLLDAFTEDYVAHHPVTYQDDSAFGEGGGRDGYSEKDEEAIRERLQALGYVA